MVTLACFLAVNVLGVHVVKAVHAWQVEQSAASDDVSHDNDGCGVCQFVLSTSTEATTQQISAPIPVVTAVVSASEPALVAIHHQAVEGRGPPVFVI